MPEEVEERAGKEEKRIDWGSRCTCTMRDMPTNFPWQQQSWCSQVHILSLSFMANFFKHSLSGKFTSCNNTSSYRTSVNQIFSIIVSFKNSSLVKPLRKIRPTTLVIMPRVFISMLARPAPWTNQRWVSSVTWHALHQSRLNWHLAPAGKPWWSRSMVVWAGTRPSTSCTAPVGK